MNKNNEICSRKNKLMGLRNQEKIVYPNDFCRDITLDQLRIKYSSKTNEELDDLNLEVKVVGRIMQFRHMGKILFITLNDFNSYVQLYVVSNFLPDGVYENSVKKLDLGDIIGARGKLFKTRTCTLSVKCVEVRLLVKSIRPLPSKFYGLHDQEICYRRRYLDLLVNDKTRHRFKMRFNIISEIRKYMIEEGFIEVETPMMQLIPGGAQAKPFMTHHKSLDVDMYLRISPELYLKKLIVGGFEKIFELNRSFRNEGLSSFHNPEFTMMELYVSYVDHNYLVFFVEKFFNVIAKRVLGSSIVKYGKEVFDFSKQFTKMTMQEAICYYVKGIKLTDINNVVHASKIVNSLGIEVSEHWGLGKIQTVIFEKAVEHHLIQPTFITSYPAEVSPLARRNDDNPFFSDRFELFIAGKEIVNGFAELNDPYEQKKQFLKQIDDNHLNKMDNNYEYTNYYDEEYIIALEYGLPPVSGVGIGIDRMVMLLTNSYTIRDVILFPALRPQK